MTYPLDPDHLIADEESLRAAFGHTSDRIWEKSTNVLSLPMKRFLKLSPFCCICSHDRNGKADISPRGDAPGFVLIADDSTLVIPDRPGNRRYDTFRNIFETGRLALIFMIPGVLVTLRIAGTARISRDPALLNQFPVDGKLPTLVTIVDIEEAYGHCSKALKRSKLWESDFRAAEHDAPSLLDMMTAHLSLSSEVVEETAKIIDRDAATNLY